MTIVLDPLTGPAIRALLREHLDGMAALSPIESVHALGLEQLKKADVTFWSAWEADDLLGCGALKQLAPDHGEIKSMRTATRHLRKGVAKELLAHVIAEARRRAYTRLSLETGSAEAFEPARRLYASLGFTFCGPFTGYVEDPYSVFMTLAL